MRLQLLKSPEIVSVGLLERGTINCKSGSIRITQGQGMVWLSPTLSLRVEEEDDVDYFPLLKAVC